MTRRDRHGGGGTAVDLTPLWVLGAVAAAVLLLMVLWLGGTLGAFLSGAGWNPPPFSIATLIRAMRGREVWPGADPAWVTGGVIAVGLVLIAAVTALAVMTSRWWASSGGLARRDDVADLAPHAATAKAKRLRRSLADIKPAKIEPGDVGIALGDLDPSGPLLRASWEDVALVFMGPRSGKTSSLAAPITLEAPGPAVVTSNKSDIYALTMRARAAKGTVWLFDPQGITHAPQRMWWDMLAAARTIEGADRLAMHLINGASSSGHRDDFWSKAGRSTLRILLHAAALDDDRSLVDVLDWLSYPTDKTPVEILRGRGLRSLAESLEGTVAGAPETRDGIFEHARQAVTCLLDPAVLAWVTPGDDPFIDTGPAEFDPHEFAVSTDTLYLLSKDGGGSAAGVIAALTDACMRAGITAAEASLGGRLDPPMVAVLDEAANVCKIEDLPLLYSHLGSRGIVPVTVLQSYKQSVITWGRDGADTLWSNATIKLLGPGLDDHGFADQISHLVGLQFVNRDSSTYSTGGRSVTRSRQRERIMDAADVREIEKGTALLFATSMRPALLRLRPWWKGSNAAAIAAQQAEVEAEIVQRAQKRSRT
ncbi:TraM recognition domain-containing protein [Marinactinospora rubrisoli]|uniref:TraM recognition domain-containing protein n=1 Tax=Marinactinospora rubrisoli TaxID=2715399 RepID=A0ABW2KNE1_9ACTN